MLAVIVWVNNFQASKIQAIFDRLFCDSNDIARGSNREGSGWGLEAGHLQNILFTHHYIFLSNNYSNKLEAE